MKDKSPVIVNDKMELTNIYLITPATNEEIINRDYVEFNGVKISSNPKKHAIIKDVKL